MKSLFTSSLSYPFILRIRASAGAGKTYTLMQAFLWHLAQLEPSLENLKSLVALTFTNKATKEMKSRIIKGLKEIILGTPAGQKLAQEIGFSSSKSQRWLERIFEHYASFQVKTIDSFLFSLLSLLGLDQNWPKNLFVELKETLILEQLIDNFFRNKAPQSEELFTSYLNIEKPSGFYLQPKLKSRIMDLITTRLANRVEKKEGTEVDLTSLEQKLNTLGLDLVESIYQKDSKAEWKYSWNNNLKDPLTNLNSSCFSKSSVKELLKKDYQGLVEEREETLFAQIKETRNAYLLALAKAKVKSYTQICNYLEKELAKLQSQEGFLLPSKWYAPLLTCLEEFNLPHIFCLLGERWKHFLLDEFQDTSLEQWQILKFFIENSLSEGGSLILVGDSKQSIYIWRNANPEIFNQIERDFSLEVKDCLLEYNWRSTPEVIEFNNNLFSQVREKLDLILENLAKDNNELKEKIQTFFAEVKQKPAPKPTNIQGKTVYLALEEQEEIERKVISTLKELQKHYSLKDIAILCRRNQEVSHFTSLLWQADLPAISENSLLLETSRVIRGLISWLSFLDSPLEDLYLLGSFFLLKENPDISLYSQKEPDKPLLLALKENHPELFDKLAFYLNQTSYLSCYDLVQLFLTEEDIYGRFPEHLPFIEYFLELIFTTNLDFLPLSSFLTFWEERKTEQFLEVPENLDALRLLTIHSAKGLEFPVVIVPKIDWEPEKVQLLYLPQEGLVRIKKPYAEEIKPYLEKEQAQKAIESLNLLYVALTRAERELYCFYQDRGVGKILKTLLEKEAC